jgi:hypothetical protein
MKTGGVPGKKRDHQKKTWGEDRRTRLRRDGRDSFSI